jgi:hypothetical protein
LGFLNWLSLDVRSALFITIKKFTNVVIYLYNKFLPRSTEVNQVCMK